MISSNFEHCLLFIIYNYHDNAMKLVGDIDMVNKLIVYCFYDIKERE